MVDIGEQGLYKINVLEIVQNWAGYPLQEQCIGAIPAKNAGVVEVKCFINNFCPFTKVDPVENTLVFNERTLEKVLPDFPAIYRNVLMTTEGTEGLHFAPRYVFRNNYMYKIKEKFESIALKKEKDISDDSVFDDIYEEITSGRGSVPGVDKTRYKKEQSWVSMQSVFDTNFTNQEGEVECNRSKWVYAHDSISENNMTINDLIADYDTATYLEYQNSFVKDPETGRFELKPDTKPVIEPFLTQFPQQQRTTDELGRGVHWRVGKRTPLFRGEDFFIRFNKTAKNSTVNEENADIPKFNIDYYNFLDVTETSKVVWDPKFPDITLPINNAVKQPVDKDTEKAATKYYDLSSQAYYIVELGHRSLKDNFFIIITERTFPICVNVQRGVSKIMGKPFGGIRGKSLIDSDWFVMTVRNHLGNLVIEFEGKGFKTEPWVIGKEEWEIETGEDAEGGASLPSLTTKPAIAMVPRGNMTIWGGNLKCGFVFGPLQYASGEAGFIYPPRRLATDEELVVSINSSGGINIDGDGGGSIANPFFLPLSVRHELTFAHPAIDKYEFSKEIADGGRDFIQVPRGKKLKMFTQDAQYYNDYIEPPGSRWRYEEEYGSYYYKETLKEIGYVANANAKIKGKTSGITIQKFRFMNNGVSNYQAFDTAVHMLVGDHVFSRDGTTYDTTMPDTGAGKGTWVRSGSYSDDEWLLGNCKTPIMTGLRLVSFEGDVPRWDDGTLLEFGQALTPFDNPFNPYFIDATDHVLSYSDSWSATDYTQVDHTGSINFLLGAEFPFGHNVTDKLYALQNKTFYIEIWAGYRDCNYTNVPGFFKMFTGLCHGGEVKYEYGKNVMSCKIVDFTDVLKDMLFFNSPFFDGQRDINAINEILRLAGFRYKGPVDPANLVHGLTLNSNNNNSTIFFRHIDGRSFKMEPYALPSGYNRLDQPMFKFNDGTSFLDGIAEISKKSAKVFFFDQMGIAHYEDLGDLIEQDFQGKMPLVALYAFTTNPEIFPGQVVFNSVEHSYAVQDVFSHIKMLSNTPDMHLLLMDRINFPAINNPEVEGFIGYKRTFYQQEGLFGSKGALIHATNKYSVMFRPYVTYKFETYGVPVRANDIVQINGENARVMNVSHEFDPAQNRWWMNVECKRYQPIGVALGSPGP